MISNSGSIMWRREVRQFMSSRLTFPTWHPSWQTLSVRKRGGLDKLSIKKPVHTWRKRWLTSSEEALSLEKPPLSCWGKRSGSTPDDLAPAPIREMFGGEWDNSNPRLDWLEFDKSLWLAPPDLLWWLSTPICKFIHWYNQFIIIRKIKKPFLHSSAQSTFQDTQYHHHHNQNHQLKSGHENI